MFQETFVREYVRNPFLWWMLFVIGITSFDSVFLANMIMQAIVVHQLYVPILFGSLTFVFIRSFYPIRRGLIDFGRKESKITAIVFIVLICMIFYTEVIYFMISPYEIFAALSPGTVSDKTTFHIDIYAKDLAELLALPLLSSFTFTIIKNKLIKGKYSVNDKITNNLKFVVYVVIVITMTYFLDIFLTSSIWLDLNTWFWKNLGDAPTWMLAITTPISILIGFLIARQQLKQNTKIEEQKFFFKIDEVFTRPGNVTIRYMINDEVNLGKPIDTTDPDTAKMIDDYLNHLEFICNMYQEKIISKSMIDAFAGMRISNALKCGSIRLYITDERANADEPTLWETLEKVGEELNFKSQN